MSVTPSIPEAREVVRGLRQTWPCTCEARKGLLPRGAKPEASGHYRGCGIIRAEAILPLAAADTIEALLEGRERLGNSAFTAGWNAGALERQRAGSLVMMNVPSDATVQAKVEAQVLADTASRKTEVV